MKFQFNQEQKELLNKIRFGFDVNDDLDEELYIELMEKVPDYLMLHGFDENYTPNEIGRICEDIITILTAHK
ncbi:MAG: hypothetical protein GXZ06_02370 [Tissierellia bacterium]|nr:hypothetical protein [Tissierellia bacterium]